MEETWTLNYPHDDDLAHKEGTIKLGDFYVLNATCGFPSRWARTDATFLKRIVKVLNQEIPGGKLRKHKKKVRS